MSGALSAERRDIKIDRPSASCTQRVVPHFIGKVLLAQQARRGVEKVAKSLSEFGEYEHGVYANTAESDVSIALSRGNS